MDYKAQIQVVSSIFKFYMSQANLNTTENTYEIKLGAQECQFLKSLCETFGQSQEVGEIMNQRVSTNNY